jgi:hypothetical protein
MTIVILRVFMLDLLLGFNDFGLESTGRPANHRAPETIVISFISKEKLLAR